MASRRVSARQKKLVAERAGGHCEYCQSQVRFAIDSFAVEHIIPSSRHGTNLLDNLAYACLGCNNFKYNKTKAEDPISGELVPLYHPRKQQWREHFTWSNDFTFVIGLTPIGRASVELLQLNREGLVNFRRVLYAMGEHPPVDTREIKK